MRLTDRIRSAAVISTLALGIVWSAATAQKGGSSANNEGCLNNAKQLSLAVQMYCQDYDEQMPPMKSYGKFQTVVMPYVRSQSAFGCPANGTRYALNTKLHQMKLKKIKAPASTFLLTDMKAHPDGTWTVAYADGHVKREKKKPIK